MPSERRYTTRNIALPQVDYNGFSDGIGAFQLYDGDCDSTIHQRRRLLDAAYSKYVEELREAGALPMVVMDPVDFQREMWKHRPR